MKADIIKLSDSTFSLEGNLGFATVGAINKKAKQLFAPECLTKPELVFDCSNLEHCDSAGIALIIEWQKLSERRGIKMRFSHITSQMQKLMNLMELTGFFANEQ